MRKQKLFIGVVLLSACTSAPKTECEKVLGACRAAYSVSADRVLPSFRIKNRTQQSRLNWANVSIPFPKGQITTEAELGDFSVPNGFADWKVLKWHWENGQKHSVAIASLRAAVELGALQESVIPIVMGEPVTPEFQFGDRLAHELNQPTIPWKLHVMAKLVNDPEIYYSPWTPGSQKLIEQRKSRITMRYRDHFKKYSVGAPVITTLSLTSFVSVDSFTDQGQVVFTIGNDTLERPVSGGIQVEWIQVVAQDPFEFRVLNPQTLSPSVNTPQSFKFGPFGLADGGSVIVRGRFGVKGSPWHSEYVASASDPLYGVPLLGASKDSRAFGLTGVIPAPRFTSREQAAASLEGLRALPVKTAKAEICCINKSPSNTGDQADFSSNLPAIAIKTLQAETSAPLHLMMAGVDREVLRHGFMWKTRNGIVDRVKASDFPNLFYWSSRIHNDFTWNTAYPQWQSRTGAFQVGPTDGWGTHDNQHTSLRHLLAAYELTADPFLKDVIEHYQTVFIWDFYTKYFTHTDAERAQRLVKEALSVALLIDSPEAEILKQKIAQKNRDVVLPGVAQLRTRYGVPSLAPADSCDARINGGTWCNSIDRYSVAVAWQAGFNLETQSLLYRTGIERVASAQIMGWYLDAAPYYFQPDGQPATYFMLGDPLTKRIYSGIGETWWSGWLQAAALFPGRAPVVDQQFKLRFRSIFSSDPNTFPENWKWWSVE